MYDWNGKMYRRGDGGSHIRVLQQALTDLGYDTGIDGDYGPKTENAVKAIQKEAGLGADGILGPKTVAAMNKIFSDRIAEQARRDAEVAKIPMATSNPVGTAAAQAAAPAAAAPKTPIPPKTVGPKPTAATETAAKPGFFDKILGKKS